jgi:Ca-activated chloride channel family protein
MLYFLYILPLFAAIFIYRFYKKDAALRRFAETELLPQINFSVSRTLQWWKAVAVLTAVFMVIISLTRPAWTPKQERVVRAGRDIAVVLDVSGSMKAEDLKPNRLEHAKLAIRDLLDRLEGNRIALVVFAGSAVLKCPLTLDYGFFRMVLDDISTDSVARGGTRIGDGLQETVETVFSDDTERGRDLILITDGEDHDSQPIKAAVEAVNKGICIIAIGLGDEKEGERIPTINENGERTFLQFNDHEVWTRLDDDMLRSIVDVCPEGKYLHVGTGMFDLGSIYRSLAASAEKREIEFMAAERFEEKFQVPLAAGLLLLLLELLIPERKSWYRLLTSKESGATTRKGRTA